MSKSNYLIIGTAGHIDHGKTALVKALTGVDTDRHKEEKERGISIDVGFAPLLLPDGRTVGIVDVPGHERFIKNMLAGAAGIDMMLLVIDVNEGMMPQTREHLQILQLLDVNKGIVVLTKTDTVDEEWLDMVREEVKEELKGTVLADAPILAVSSVTGKGLEQLKRTIARLAEEIVPRDVQSPLRMPIDRVFSLSGFGTIVTGTLLAGSISLGETVELLPAGKRARVRSIQVHGQAVERAVAGQRTALNLAGVEKKDIRRGDVVVPPGVCQPTTLIAARLRVLDDAFRSVRNRQHLRFYIGTAEGIARVNILDRDEIIPGEDALVQLELEEPLVCEARDRFIIRSLSPMFTLGGGTVIDPHPRRLYRRKRPSILQQLVEKEQGGPERQVLEALAAEPGLREEELIARVHSTPPQLQKWLERLLQQKLIIPLPEGQGFVRKEDLERLLAEIEEKMRSHFTKNRYARYAGKAQLQSQLRERLRPQVFHALLRYGEEQGLFELEGERVTLKGYEVHLSLRERKLAERLRERFQQAMFQPPSLSQLLDEEKEMERWLAPLLYYLTERGELIQVGEDLYFSREAVDKARSWARELATHGDLTVAQLRDRLQTSRKYTLALLEYFDRKKWTRREGDYRVWIAGEMG